MGLFCDAMDDAKQTDTEFYKRVFEGITWWQNGEMHPKTPEFWKYAPMGGQWIASNEQAMNNATLSDLQRRAKIFYSTYLTIERYPTTMNSKLSANQIKDFMMFQKSLGYRYVINKVTSPKEITTGTIYPVKVELTNVGNAPFYFDWKLTMAIIDSTGNVAASKEVASIKDWMPHNSYTIDDSLTVPNTIPNGEYTVCFYINSPITGEPGIKFANNESDSKNIVKTSVITIKR